MAKENKHNGAASEVTEGDILAVGVGQREVGSCLMQQGVVQMASSLLSQP